MLEGECQRLGQCQGPISEAVRFQGDMFGHDGSECPSRQETGQNNAELRRTCARSRVRMGVEPSAIAVPAPVPTPG